MRIAGVGAAASSSSSGRGMGYGTRSMRSVSGVTGRTVHPRPDDASGGSESRSTRKIPAPLTAMSSFVHSSEYVSAWVRRARMATAWESTCFGSSAANAPTSLGKSIVFFRGFLTWLAHTAHHWCAPSFADVAMYPVSGSWCSFAWSRHLAAALSATNSAAARAVRARLARAAAVASSPSSPAHARYTSQSFANNSHSSISWNASWNGSGGVASVASTCASNAWIERGSGRVTHRAARSHSCSCLRVRTSSARMASRLVWNPADSVRLGSSSASSCATRSCSSASNSLSSASRLSLASSWRRAFSSALRRFSSSLAAFSAALAAFSSALSFFLPWRFGEKDGGGRAVSGMGDFIIYIFLKRHGRVGDARRDPRMGRGVEGSG